MTRPAMMLMVAMVLVALVGCVSVPTADLSQSTRAMEPDAVVMADAIDAMVRVFPPALTPLTVKQADSSAFGRNLLEGLRERGYAVTERDGAGQKVSRAQAVLGAQFSYRMAPIADTSMYELVLTVSDTKLSRLYIFNATESRLYPGGEWSRRE